MLVAVMIGGGQLMVHFERGGKGREGQEDRHQGKGEPPSDQRASDSGYAVNHTTA